jgi:hypothetical protein
VLWVRASRVVTVDIRCLWLETGALGLSCGMQGRLQSRLHGCL